MPAEAMSEALVFSIISLSKSKWITIGAVVNASFNPSNAA